MRTVEEIQAAFTARGFTFTQKGKGRKATLWLHMGTPPVFVCAEPTMTLRLTGAVNKKTAARRIPIPVMGPLARVAVSRILELTPDEASATGMTIEAALAEFTELCGALLKEAGIDGDLTPITLSDPEWGR